MKTKELIETLRVCADDDIICPACERYNTMGKWGGTARCNEDLMLKAAEALERLEAELKAERYRHDRLQDFEVAEAEELQKVRERLRWIPVTEKLPENEDAVIVIVDGNHKNVVFCGAYLFASYDPSRGWWLEDYPEAIDFAVLCWMPLPEPPRECNKKICQGQ